MKSTFVLFMLLFISINLTGQNCSILSKANIIVPDKLCSPVSVVWQVNYNGVNNAGTPVVIQYIWDDGTTDMVAAVNTGPGSFQASANHTYVSIDDKCNYAPSATLVVNGVVCNSSSQQQVVTVWDNDNNNGGHMHIDPAVYPICVGNAANVRFQDLTQFNCVPPQENDVPNLFTRWVQWIYGTDNTMTGLPVRINGLLRPFAFYGPVITLPGPVTGSGVFSDIINVTNDKLVGQYFQVTLRNWNYCNPYDDPNIPGPPVDLVNGDFPPVVTTAIILIVPYPDATITPVDTLCVQNAPVTLTAHDPGGVWSGNGVTGDVFNPATAGPGNHIIQYNLTTGSGCSDNDMITITVMPAPVANINPVPSVLINDPPVAIIVLPPGGTFTGTGITGNIFNPSVAGIGTHIINYQTLTDRFGCSGTDTIHIIVHPVPPDVTITHVDTLCVQNSPVILAAHDPGGTWSGTGVIGNLFDPALAGTGNHIVTYQITDIYGYIYFDQITITVMPPPTVILNPVSRKFVNDPPVLLTATPPGGVFSGNGVAGNFFNPLSAGIGIHVITYQSLNDRFGCKASDTINIRVYQRLPDATITPVDTLCIQSSPFFLTAHDQGGTWSGAGVVGSLFNPLLAGVGNHIIRYQITDINGYTDSDQIIITVMPPPVVIVSTVGRMYLNDPPVLLAASPAGGVFFGKGIAGNFFNPLSAGIGIHVITYQALNDRFGCTASDTINIRVYQTLPDATITPVDTLCVQSSPVVLSAHDPGGIWTGPGVAGNVFNPKIAGAGNHIIRYFITDINGNTDSDQITVTVTAPPSANINSVGTVFINSPPVVLTATPPGGVFTGIGLIKNIFNPASAGVGIHIIMYTTLTDRYGCSGTDTIHINVILPQLPIAKFIPDTTGCAPLLVKFRNMSLSGDSYLWDFGDKTFSTAINPSHTYYLPGDYIVRLIVTNIAGNSSATSLITVNQNPTASFNVYPTEVINNAQVVVFTNFSINADSYLWKFGDGNSSTEKSPWHKYESEGVYSVVLRAVSMDGCIDSMKYYSPIVVEYKTGNIKFPNVFRWNLSGPTGGYWEDNTLNDNLFRPFAANVLSYKLQIFNRWGVLIYESHDLHKGWDGYFGDGNLALQGVYVYKASGQYTDGTYFNKVGDVTFLH